MPGRSSNGRKRELEFCENGLSLTGSKPLVCNWNSDSERFARYERWKYIFFNEQNVTYSIVVNCRFVWGRVFPWHRANQ